MSLNDLRRREFLKRSAALSTMGAAAPWALNLAAIGEAAAQVAGGYRAIVCVFLYGGNDYANTLVPYDAASYAEYFRIRSTIATAQGALAATALTPDAAGALPAGRQMALAPELAPLKTIFDAGRMAVLLNVGPLIQPTTLDDYRNARVPLPPKLFSHNDQQSVWQSSLAEGATSGWGGRIGDLFLGANGTATFTCINASGNAVFMAGENAVQYQVNTTNGAIALNAATTLYGSAACSAALRALVTAARSHQIESAHTTVFNRALGAGDALRAAVAAAPAFPAFTTDVLNQNALAAQLQMVARIIAGRAQLGATRQVFFVSLGGFDNHDFLLTQHGPLLDRVGKALAAFYDTTVQLGVADQVTSFTASDFGRTLSSNGDGSDHGWGSHHFVVGGAVSGRRYYGALPATAVNGPDDVGNGRLLPTTSVDQLAATLAAWMGITSASDLERIVPNLRNFSLKNLGFL